MKAVHEKIKEYREQNGLSQTHIAKITGISNKKISNIESGRTQLKLDEYIILCEKGLNVEPSFFLRKKS